MKPKTNGSPVDQTLGRNFQTEAANSLGPCPSPPRPPHRPSSLSVHDPELAETRPPAEKPSPGYRRPGFRLIRLLLAGGLIYATLLYANYTLNFVSSSSAYIGAETVLLRTPIDGNIDIPAYQPGRLLRAGDSVFRVINPRFGNKEATARLAWASDYEDRLHIETAEALVQFRQQEKIFAYHKNLYTEALIAELEFVEEQTKWAMAHATLTNKQFQLKRARERRQKAEKQVDLQQQATSNMPFCGVVWQRLAQDGQYVSANEPVVQVIDPSRVWVEAVIRERHADQVQIGSRVDIQTCDGLAQWEGRVESIRGDFGQGPTLAQGTIVPDNPQQRQVIVRISMDTSNPFGPREFFGIGRPVNVTLSHHE